MCMTEERPRGFLRRSLSGLVQAIDTVARDSALSLRSPRVRMTLRFLLALVWTKTLTLFHRAVLRAPSLRSGCRGRH